MLNDNKYIVCVDYFQKTKEFSYLAEQYNKTGLYTNSITGTIEYIEFWQDVKDKCLNGFTNSCGQKITGIHFFYLNFCPILGLNEKTGKKSRWSLEDMYQLFPRLKERQNTAAGVLSGGEQQMLSLCRTLMGDPDLIMIDEPTEGLAPKIVDLVAEFLKELKHRGISVLLVEQKLAIALEISQRVYVMGHGSIVFEGTPDDLRNNDIIRREWLEV